MTGGGGHSYDSELSGLLTELKKPYVLCLSPPTPFC